MKLLYLGWKMSLIKIGKIHNKTFNFAYTNYKTSQPRINKYEDESYFYIDEDGGGCMLFYEGVSYRIGYSKDLYSKNVYKGYWIFHNTLISIDNGKVERHQNSLSEQYHLSKTGVYSFGEYIEYFDFQRKKKTKLMKLSSFLFCKDIYFYKGYLCIQDKTETHIYLNSYDLPENVDINFLNKIAYSMIPDSEYTINFRDTVKTFPASFLNKFKSRFLYEQISESEIYLDIDLKDFNTKNLETLSYLMSSKTQKIYKKKLLHDLFNETVK